MILLLNASIGLPLASSASVASTGVSVAYPSPVEDLLVSFQAHLFLFESTGSLKSGGVI